MTNTRLTMVIGGIVCINAASAGEVVVLEDKSEWLALVKNFDTIDFTGLTAGSVVTNQYADHGILFTDGHDFADDNDGYPNDGEGLYGGFRHHNGEDLVHIDTTSEQFWFAVEFPGLLQVRLFQGDKLLFEAPLSGGPETDNFLGLVSDEPFDRVHIEDIINSSVFIDDLHFGPPICVADVDGDESVGFEDLLAILSAWGNNGGREDLDANGLVDFDDLLTVLDAWGACGQPQPLTDSRAPLRSRASGAH